MNRRTLLGSLNALFSAASAAIVAVPGVSFVWTSVQRRGGDESAPRRLARLQDLPVNQPVQRAIVGSRRDSWTAFADEVIGVVWLVRRTGDDVPAEEARVDAFSAVCPHLGCTVALQAEGHFLCPCHNGGFDLTGAPLPAQALGHRNPAPRGMDRLDCQVVADGNGDGDGWIEVTYREFELGLADSKPRPA
jgi:Rieske Fe-S protein